MHKIYCGIDPVLASSYDVKSSSHLAEVIAKNGGKPRMCRTGHSYVKSTLKQSGALLAGEMSGHIFFNDRWYGFDDALYTAARLLEIYAGGDQTCSDMFAVFPQGIGTPELNIHLKDEGDQHTFMNRFLKLAFFEDAQLDYTDGVRVNYDDGWGLVRASNTTPCLVVRFEADNKARLNEIKDIFRKQLLSVESSLQIPF